MSKAYTMAFRSVGMCGSDGWWIGLRDRWTLLKFNGWFCWEWILGVQSRNNRFAALGGPLCVSPPNTHTNRRLSGGQDLLSCQDPIPPSCSSYRESVCASGSLRHEGGRKTRVPPLTLCLDDMSKCSYPFARCAAGPGVLAWSELAPKGLDFVENSRFRDNI